MPLKSESKVRVDFDRVCARLDEVDADMPLRRKTLDDVVRVIDGEIKPVTVFRNLTRRIEAGKQGQGVTL